MQDNTPELEGDRAARRELQARLAQAEEAVTTALQSFLNPSASEFSCVWFRKGARRVFSDARALQEFVSNICDEVFHQTPILHNELINRRHISGSAASARRELLSAMLMGVNEPALGIKGFPPHLSMYFSLLQETGLHREEDGKWEFYAPPELSDNATARSVQAMWRAVDGFLAETEIERRTIADLFDSLSQQAAGDHDQRGTSNSAAPRLYAPPAATSIRQRLPLFCRRDA